MNWRIPFCLALPLLMGGCSTLYDRKWEAAPVPVAGLEGRWEGRWRSETTGHEGPLRCLVTRREGHLYDFHFWAAWSLLSASWHLDLEARPEGEITHLSGERNLGILLGGVYTFTATVQGDRVEARYRSRKERGTFALDRVGQVGADP